MKLALSLLVLIVLFIVTQPNAIADQTISSDPSGVTLIGAKHPNLWYNQSEIDKLRKMILVDKSPSKLVSVYNTYAKGQLAVYPPAFGTDVATSNPKDGSTPDGKVDWYDGYVLGSPVGKSNMKACVSYMIEPTSGKADKIKDVIFAFMAKGASWYKDPQACGHVNWSLAWMYDLTYNAGIYTDAEKAQIEAFFSEIVSLVKSGMGNGYRDNMGTVNGYPISGKHVHEGMTRGGYKNWYAFVAGGAVCAALNGNDQDLLDFFTKSQNTNLYTNPYSQGVTSTSPDPDTCYVRDLYQYVNGMVFPSGATWDHYQRDIEDSNYPGPKSSYTAAECTDNLYAGGPGYNEFSLAGIYLGLEAASHNGWNGWNEDVYGGKPGMQRAIDFQCTIDKSGKYPSATSALSIRRFYTTDTVIQSYFNGSDSLNIDKSQTIYGNLGRIFCYPMYSEQTSLSPVVITGTATDITSNSAMLSGTVNANGSSTTVWFDYGTDNGSYSSQSSTQTVSGTSSTSASVSVGGLLSGKTYYYRIAAQNRAGTIYGIGKSFTTSITDSQGETNSNSLQACYNFNEGTGTTAADSSGNENNGTIDGATWAAGKYGNGLSFDGVDDYVDLGNTDIENNGYENNGLTIALWFRADNFDINDGRLISKAKGTKEQDHYWMLSTEKSNDNNIRLRFRLKTNGTTNTLVATAGELITGEWTFAVATYDGNYMKLYKDGVLIGSVEQTGNIDTDNTIPAWIGGNPSSATSRPFGGIIDEVRIYNRSLREDEIQELFVNALAGYWKFNEGTGTTAADSSGNENNGTIDGATWAAGKYGNGLSFDGVDDYVSIPLINYEEISISARFYENANDTTYADAIFGAYRWNGDTQLCEGYRLRFYQDEPEALGFILAELRTTFCNENNKKNKIPKYLEILHRYAISHIDKSFLRISADPFSLISISI